MALQKVPPLQTHNHVHCHDILKTTPFFSTEHDIKNNILLKTIKVKILLLDIFILPEALLDKYTNYWLDPCSSLQYHQQIPSESLLMNWT
jgi:hypothetical protein